MFSVKSIQRLKQRNGGETWSDQSSGKSPFVSTQLNGMYCPHVSKCFYSNTKICDTFSGSFWAQDLCFIFVGVNCHRFKVVETMSFAPKFTV